MPSSFASFGPGTFAAITPGSFAQSWFADQPQAAYTYGLGLGGFGLGNQTKEAQYYRAAYPRMEQQYYAQLPFRGPGFSFTDYLAEGLPQLGREWTGLSPEQRGENPSQTVGRLRWVF